jgi:hypothetical protein
MNKKASMMSLLIVALVALGLMAFVSVNSVTGDAIGKAISRPSVQSPQLPSQPTIPSRDVTKTVTVQEDDDVDYVYTGDSAVQNAIIENTIVTCDVAKAMGLQEKMSQKSISICQNLLWPFI